MKIAAYTVLLLLLVGCNSSADKTKTEERSADSNATAKLLTSEIFPVQPIKLTKEQLPGEIKFKGTLQEAWQWKDKLGENVLITSSFGPIIENDRAKLAYEEEGKTLELHAFHFIKRDTGWKKRWMISDAEKVCPFDLTAAFIKNSTVITDLDKDGIAETTIQYKMACRSDVSPSYMKIIMHEDTAKYTLRGNMWVQYSDDVKFAITEKDVNLEKLPKQKVEMEDVDHLAGRYETEKEFANAPPVFLVHARNQWLKHAKESFD